MKKIVENFISQGGKHCVTNSLKQVFNYYGYPISEEMIFGLASGIDFLYLNQSTSPMVSGRTKVFAFEERLAKRLGISMKCKSGSDYDKVNQITKDLINQNKPVLIYVDMPYLRFLGLDENSHFGGHAIVLFGYDDNTQQFLISDRDNHDFPIRTPLGSIAEDYHLISYSEMQMARSSKHRPFPVKNKYLLIDFEGYCPICKSVLAEAIKETCDTMLNSPAQLLGLNGILKFSKEILKWAKFNPEKLKLAGTANYFMINKDGGTGGGIFRKMYGNFLIEAAPIMENNHFAEIGKQFIAVSEKWDKIADLLWELSLTGDASLLSVMSDLILENYQKEKELFLALMQNI